MKRICSNIVKNKSWLILAVLAVCVASCADEWSDVVSRPSEWTIEVASPETVVTRSAAESREIHNLIVMSFDNLNDANAVMQQVKIYDESELTRLGEGRYKVAIESSWGGNLLFVANASQEAMDKIKNLGTGATMGSLSAVALSSDDVNVMLQEQFADKWSNASTVSIGRVVAKVSATVDAGVQEAFKLSAISLHRGSLSSNLYAVATGTASEMAVIGADYSSTTLYSLPCSYDATYLIVKASYGGEECYYRADFKGSDGVGLDIESNHHYEFHITEVRSKGYASPEEAAQHVGAINGFLYDHQPVIYDMISDGMSELGVQDTVRFSGAGTDGQVKVEVPVKWSSKGELDATVPDVYMENGGDWFLLNYNVTGETVIDEPVGQSGVLFHYEFSVPENPTNQSRTAVVRVTKDGLSRTSVLVQESNDYGRDLAVEMWMRESADASDETETEHADYWKFLDAAQGVPSTRLNGLHMPRAITRYQISVPSTGRLAGYTIKQVVNSTQGKLLVNGQPSVTIDNPSVPLQITPNFSQVLPGVITGGLRLVLGKSGSADITVTYDIYRTGIFQNESNNLSWRQDSEAGKNAYYYYEVVYIGGRLWLDRNLGASANGMAVGQPGGSYMGDSKSAGGLYKLGDTPSNSAMTLKNICPRHYRLPTATEFNTLLSASDFRINLVSSENGNYWAPTYDLSGATATGGPNQIYFPLNRMYYNGSLSGDVNAGYYWTQSEAVGSTDGKWVQLVKFMGNNASFVRQKIYEDGAIAAMSVRCIDDAQITEETVHAIEFYVKGCTHVFLYGKTNGQITLLNTWPGVQIAVDDASSLAMYHVFSYESLVAYDEYYAIFSNNGAEGETYPSIAGGYKGYKVENGRKYAISFANGGSVSQE